MMSHSDLAAVDLNLLVALDALLSEHSVTRAGKRIGLSQPAMSYALSRLRQLLDDPLLVRGRDGMHPTPRAKALAPQVRRILDDIRATMLSGRGFDPATDSGSFVIATNDYCGHVLVPALMQAVAANAPAVQVRIRRPGSEFPMSALEQGEFDLVLGTYPQTPASLEARPLVEDGFVCVLRRDHPLLDTNQRPRQEDNGRPQLTLDEYASMDHVLISSPSEARGVVDYELEKHGRQRRVAVYVPDFLVAPAIVARTDYVLTLAERIAASMAASHGLHLLAPPLPLPTFTVSMVWHQRTAADPACQWLRDTLISVASGLPHPAA